MGMGQKELSPASQGLTEGAAQSIIMVTIAMILESN
jgi:hypothetical protein